MHLLNEIHFFLFLFDIFRFVSLTKNKIKFLKIKYELYLDSEVIGTLKFFSIINYHFSSKY